jgi:hypothetical protein
MPCNVAVYHCHLSKDLAVLKALQVLYYLPNLYNEIALPTMQLERQVQQLVVAYLM